MTETKVIGSCCIDNEDYVILVSPATDGTAAELTIRDRSGNLKNIKDSFAGRTMTSFWLTVGTPSDLDLIQFKGSDGGIIYEWGGAINAALGQVPQIVVENINAVIEAGTAFEVTTSD
jgi:hypothetical protein